MRLTPCKASTKADSWRDQVLFVTWAPFTCYLVPIELSDIRLDLCFLSSTANFCRLATDDQERLVAYREELGCVGIFQLLDLTELLGGQVK